MAQNPMVQLGVSIERMNLMATKCGLIEEISNGMAKKQLKILLV